ncbi:bifunctional diguanylate cyclase/phosphodiesterase [Nitrosovibrio sp. Nv4]|uniref:bifunctional diguanylate cyclase/phosphodiesterase n=1 Tax=Nitrosovibrio sp. Nv4 TaxID=1945880 RepID=UPI000BD550DE|nr:EAL domain-containing protein [Nitrosovibrio sp. Nv4]SOD41817.1 PAS domain S-box-containing protein/diguanylate cyclase (GGDEF) domain-containing protein [Nitrosovibrio sp. Nv4]
METEIYKHTLPAEHTLSRRAVATLTFTIFISLTLVSWFVVHNLQERNENTRFDKVVAEVIQKIEHHFSAYEQVLKAGRGHLLASNFVSRDGWRTYVNALRINERYPGIHGVGFAKYISPSELAAHVEEIRAEGFPDYKVWPENSRQEYTSIVYLEPFSGSNLRALGYDMFSDAVRRTAMSRARDTGEAALSIKVELVQETGEDIQAGVLMYVPYYGIENLPETLGERHKSLAGYVYAPIRMDDFVRATLRTELDVLDLRIFDGGVMEESSLLFDSAKHRLGPLPDPKFKRIIPLSLSEYGQTWAIEVSSRPVFEKATKSYQAFLVLLGGILVSILTAMVAFVLSGNKERVAALGRINKKLLLAMEEQESTTLELLNSKIRTERILESIADAFYTLNREWRFTYINKEAENLLRRDRGDLLGKVIWEEFEETKGTVFDREYHQALMENAAATFEEFYVPLGKWFEVHAYPTEEGLTIYFRDITTRKEADARIRQQASLLDKATNAIIVRGIDDCIQFWNQGAWRLYGWISEEVMGRPVGMLYDSMTAFNEATRLLLNAGEWRGEIRQRRKDQSMLIIEAHWTLVRDDEGRPWSILEINTDITRRKSAENEIQYLAFYDSLTGLPNRQLLLDRLRQALASGARHRHTGALLFIDLDNFKLLNDTLGHDLGDRLLQQVAPRLISSVRDSDTVARLGGDEFVVILAANFSEDHDEAVAQVRTICERIRSAFNQPFTLDVYKHHTTPSIGIALFNVQSHTADELLKRADLAMYQAKASGRNAMCFFDPDMQAEMNARAILESDLHKSWERNEFVLHYQPQVSNDGIIGAEALVRWQHPRRGLLSPSEFIPQAEEIGLILPLGALVLETACNQLARWSLQPETAQLHLSVNVSPRQFCQPDFVEQMISTLERTGANPQRLTLELTESILVSNMDETIAKMMALKAKGLGFSLDDFGVGYSSLYYLKRLPLDWVKIDQSFIRDVLIDHNDATIVRAILLLSKSMGLAVIAEGVETLAQKDFLAMHGCSAYQGYLFSPPLPLDRFEDFVRGGGRRAV